MSQQNLTVEEVFCMNPRFNETSMHLCTELWNYAILHAVAYLVEALCYKPEGRGLDSRLGYLIFSINLFFQLKYGPGIDLAFNRN
jgi:hypothetical protein